MRSTDDQALKRAIDRVLYCRMGHLGLSPLCITWKSRRADDGSRRTASCGLDGNGGSSARCWTSPTDRKCLAVPLCGGRLAVKRASTRKDDIRQASIGTSARGQGAAEAEWAVAPSCGHHTHRGRHLRQTRVFRAQVSGDEGSQRPPQSRRRQRQ